MPMYIRGVRMISISLLESKHHAKTRATNPGVACTSCVPIAEHLSHTSFCPPRPGKSGPDTYTGIELCGHSVHGLNGGKTTGSAIENCLSIEAIRSFHSSFTSHTSRRPRKENGRLRFVAIAIWLQYLEGGGSRSEHDHCTSSLPLPSRTPTARRFKR